MRKIQDGPESGNKHGKIDVNKDDDRLAKMAKNGRSNSPGHPDGLQNISAKVGHRHRRKTGIKNRI